jgi:small subunit ribosomal protein S16
VTRGREAPRALAATNDWQEATRMAARIRLRRTGTTKRPTYRVVVADSRTARDGRFVEQIGFYDPKTEPPTIRIDTDRASAWIKKGALPSNTVKHLLARASVRGS